MSKDKTFSANVIVLIIMCIVLFLLPAVVVWYIWYDLIDTNGLVFYQESQGVFEEVYAFDEHVYILLDTNKLYISGSNGMSNHRLYKNAQGHVNEELKIREPVLIFDGNIRELIPCGALYALIITEENELFLFDDMKLSKIADNVVSAYKETEWSNTYYYVDTSSRLHAVIDNSDNVIANGMKEVVACGEFVWCIADDDVLFEGKYSEDGEFALTKVMENVADFKALPTEWHGIRYYDPPGYPSTYLMNILTNDGDLYVKGTYNALFVNDKDEDYYIEEYSDWALISEEVVKFDIAEYATAYITSDNVAHYYGFNMDYSDENEFLDTVLLDNVNTLSISVSMLIIETDEGWHFWGDIYGVSQELIQDNVLLETPFVWKKQNN